MSRESNRPTKTNYQDYLFDFSDVDFSQGAARPAEPAAAGQATPTQERGFLERLGYSALAIGEGLPMLPGRMADTIRDAWNGGDIDVTDTEALQEREQRAREQAAYAQKYQGKAFDGVTDAMISMPYSLTTLAAGIGASVPATLAAGPVAGGAAAMAASGGVAYRASKQEFMENMLEETSRVLGRRPTQEEWDRIAADFDSEATQYGLWEAGPEALGNLFFTRLLGPLGKGFLTDGLGKAVKRGIGLYGGEMGTETATQMGQGHIAAEMGWRDEAPGPLQALKEIAPATFWQTTLMAGGKKGLDLLAQRYQERAGQKGMAAGIGGPPFSPAQPAPRLPAQIPSLPTQAQITRTQETPRADTTAAAEQLGIPGPEAVPREAQRPELPPPCLNRRCPTRRKRRPFPLPCPLPPCSRRPLPKARRQRRNSRILCRRPRGSRRQAPSCLRRNLSSYRRSLPVFPVRNGRERSRTPQRKKRHSPTAGSRFRIRP